MIDDGALTCFVEINLCLFGFFFLRYGYVLTCHMVVLVVWSLCRNLYDSLCNCMCLHPFSSVVARSVAVRGIIQLLILP